MSAIKIAAIVLIEDKETANIPVWAGVGAIAIGGILLLNWNRSVSSTDSGETGKHHAANAAR